MVWPISNTFHKIGNRNVDVLIIITTTVNCNYNKTAIIVQRTLAISVHTGIETAFFLAAS